MFGEPLEKKTTRVVTTWEICTDSILLASFVVRSGAEVSKAFRFFYILYMIVDVILRLQGLQGECMKIILMY